MPENLPGEGLFLPPALIFRLLSISFFLMKSLVDGTF